MSRTLQRAALAAGLSVLTIAVFSGVFACGFVNFDDGVYVAANPHVAGGLTPRSMAWAFAATENSNWHPVTWLSHMLDVELFGMHPGPHHGTSLAFHVLNVVLLFLLLCRMTGATFRPALVAALFAIHPLHVESVAWIAERKDVLSTTLWLATLGCWLSWVESPTPRRYACVVVAFAAGLMAKPMLVTLPLTLMLLDVWPLERSKQAVLWKEKVPLFAMSSVSCAITIIAQRHGGGLQGLDRYALPARIENAVIAYAAYLEKTFWPAALAVFYPYPRPGPAPATAAAAGILLTVATVLAWRARASRPYVTSGWLWYLVTLVPVIGLVQVGQQSMADRYTYVPLIGIFVVVAWALGEMATGSPARTRVAVTLSVVALLASSILTVRQVGTWRTSETLFRHALAVTTGNWTAHNNLGGAYEDAGRTAEAISEFTEAVTIRPDFAEGHYNLGRAFDKAGRLPEAIDAYGRALAINPAYGEARYNLGNSLLRAGRAEEAIVQYREALRLGLDDAPTHNNLGIALSRTGRTAEAIAEYREALRIRPDFEPARANLARASQAAGAP